MKSKIGKCVILDASAGRYKFIVHIFLSPVAQNCHWDNEMVPLHSYLSVDSLSQIKKVIF